MIMPIVNKILFLGCNVIVVVALYIFNEYYCTESCFAFYEKPYLDPILAGLSGLAASSLTLFLSTDKVFISWLKRIASWFLPLTFILVASIDEGEGLFPMTSDGRNDMAILMMSILFLITLVYVLVMRKRLSS